MNNDENSVFTILGVERMNLPNQKVIASVY